ncbi:hypothetical protein ARMSODRAFT_347307 [Armillaria solidipes]|uniref:Uncharacterized protein n=1 Tax=Armillaria solidipes TaxID=1076256 RepID=A0A2H3BUV8_9AGAR|nr:hypothetical protein ARMSODRAFT_347307 [Armillaria solidipes]
MEKGPINRKGRRPGKAKVTKGLAMMMLTWILVLEVRRTEAHGSAGPGRVPSGPGMPSGYMRSGSNAPSRTHSPMGHATAAPPQGGYILPPPHGMSPFYTGPLATHSGHESAMGMMGGGSIPTLADLERHYMELHEQKRRMEEILDRTDRLMGDVKRGMDEIRNATASSGGALSGSQSTSQQQQQTSSSSMPAPGGSSTGAVPLARASDKDRSRENVWPTSINSESRD